MKILDKNKWNRREHFEFFSQFDEPFFGIVSEVDCTIAYQHSKELKFSFFAYYLHKSLVALNQIEELKYRIDGNKIIIFDNIHASPTIFREDETFGYSFVEYNQDFKIFLKTLEAEIAEVRNSIGLRLTKNAMRKDTVHYSSIPWINFTGLTHARNYKFEDSMPKITFGKTFSRARKLIMPIAVYVHHGLADGLHIAKFLKIYQKLLDQSIESVSKLV